MVSAVLSAFFPKFENSRFVRGVNGFFRSALYPALIAALMVASEVFSLEIPVYCIYFAVGAFCLLFADDALGILPILCCSYMTVSPENFPGPEHPPAGGGVSIFMQDWALFTVLFICFLAVILLIGRLVVRLIFTKGTGKRNPPALTAGFVSLALALLLGGAFSPAYTAGEVMFSLIEIAALCAAYFYFFYAVDWEKAPGWYIPAILVCIGVGMLLEIGDMYTLPGAVAGGTLNRGAIFTGWGTYNNVGCVTAMCIPAATYFSIHYKRGWIATALSCLLMAGVCFTQSRGAIVFGGIVFLATIVCTLVFGVRGHRIEHAVVYAVALVAIAAAVAIWREEIFAILRKWPNEDNLDSGRFNIYRNCLEQAFLPYPVFGKGFYGTAVIGNPNRAPEGIPFFAHNTFVQLLATGGVVLFTAYVFHRVQTVRMLVKNFSPENLCLALCVAALLLISMVDVHVFALGPGILYSVLLVGTEKAKKPARTEAPSPKEKSPVEEVPMEEVPAEEKPAAEKDVSPEEK